MSVECPKFGMMKILSIEKSQILRKSQVWSENSNFGVDMKGNEISDGE